MRTDRQETGNSWTDEDLLAMYRAFGGSNAARKALDELFRRHLASLAIFCYRWTGDQERAADLAQEILMQVFRRLDSFRGEARFSTWIYSIARHHCFKAMRDPYQHSVSIEDLGFDCVSSDDPYGEAVRGAAAASLRKLLRDTLTEPEIRVMMLHYAEDLPLHQITGLLQLKNPSGAKAYIVSAKRKLRAALRRLEGRL